MLEQIIEHKRREVSELKRTISISDYRSMELYGRNCNSMFDSLRNHAPFAVIAEIKRSSPSAGAMKSNANPIDIARSYEEHGAAGISVLTDARYFSGRITDLTDARSAVSLPILRKDFIIEPIQAHEAKAHGADAILLIASVLDRNELSDLHSLAAELGLESLVELYEERELEKIDFDTMKLLGVNNRDLRTMTIDLNNSMRISRQLPQGCMLVSESGIRTQDDIKRLLDADIHAGLIGEHLMKSEQPGKALQQLLESL